MSQERQPNEYLELEQTLIICSGHPQRVAKQIACLTSLANYQLLPKDSKTIHDFYLDTHEWALQNQKLALRIRESNMTHWITLKGPSRSIGWEGGEERLEIELLWSNGALTKILKELAARKVNLLSPGLDLNNIHPLDIMGRLGLTVVQDRELHRKIRNIIVVDGEGSSILAELAIDSVVYHFNDQSICHHEIEIETKAKGNFTVLKTVIGSLMAMYGPMLRKWCHSKLITGKVIEKLLDEGALDGLLDVNNNLMPRAYDKIDEYLKRNSI